MKCPVCKDADLLMTERMGVEIDYCPSCRGIWLDRGELDKLLEKAEQLAGPPGNCHGVPSRPGHHHDDEQHRHKGNHSHGGYGHTPHHSHRRSWLGNLLNFD